MKFSRFLLPLAFVLPFTCAALAQHDHGAPPPAASPEAQQLFDTLKSLAGSWEGPVTMTPPMPGMDHARIKVSLRVTSRGNAIMHEMHMDGVPDDPITMLYLDGDHVALTHYCDAGNRPRMSAEPVSGRTVAFKTVDVSGPTQKGNMANTHFTVVDANHHIEEWTYNLPNRPPMKVHFELERTKEASGAFGQ